jgi:hypothetical protein
MPMSLNRIELCVLLALSALSGGCSENLNVGREHGTQCVMQHTASELVTLGIPFQFTGKIIFVSKRNEAELDRIFSLSVTSCFAGNPA